MFNVIVSTCTIVSCTTHGKNKTRKVNMGIIYGKLLYCHCVVEGNKDNKISTLDYNNRTVYDCFNYTFTADCGIPDIHLPPITIYDIPPRIR